MILSYIIGDNALFRLAIIFSLVRLFGICSGLILYNVLWYQVLVPVLQIFTTGKVDGLVTYAMHVVPAVILGIWMTTKHHRASHTGERQCWLLGVGAATVIAGAVRGTIFPQVGASVNLLSLKSGH